MLLIQLTQGKMALIDDEDFECVSKYTWCAQNDRGIWYAATMTSGSLGLKRRQIKMHQLIIKPVSGLVIDHINRNGLDNRRCNLRLVTHSGNRLNQKAPSIRSDSTSGVTGVSFNKKSQKWMARIRYK